MEEKEKNTKTKKIVILLLCVVTIVFACILGTYAYFMVNISNNNRQEVQLDTGTMRLRFADGNPTINQNIMLGETITKTFTIENTGDLDASLNIEWLDIVNTYMEGSLTYTLEQSETQNSGYTEIISKTNVPTTETAFTTTLAPDLEIPEGKIYYYNLKITFNDLEGIDQEADKDAKLITKFTVSQPSTNRNYSLVIDPNGGMLGDTNTVQTLTKRNGTTETIGTPTKAGSKFNGWKVIGMGSTLVDGTLTMGKSNTKVIAEWEEFDPREAIIAIENNRTPKGVNTNTLNFAEPATTNEGVYSMEDDYGTSYFYRGAVTNNYVKFANFYWRIIRINGDRSVRIIYDGKQGYANGTSSADRFTHTRQAWNASYTDAKYVGWMYGPAGTEASTSKAQAQTNTANSDIKKVVDAWYKTNILDKGYLNAVSDTLFCNDRSTPSKDETGINSDTSLGYGNNGTIYGAGTRIGAYSSSTTKIEPKFRCPQKNDAFTVSDKTKGNGALTYPVGLITADEVMAAGSGKYSTANQKYYLYRGNSYFFRTFSPRNFGPNAFSFIVFTNGGLEAASVYVVTSDNNISAVAPVINLTSNYFKTLIGDGSIENPFRAE